MTPWNITPPEVTTARPAYGEEEGLDSSHELDVPGVQGDVEDQLEGREVAEVARQRGQHAGIEGRDQRVAR